MFYIIEKKYVGPNQGESKYVDEHYIYISKEPARTNSSNEIKIKGWCGTTNDYCVNAYGEYASLDDARKAIKEIFGEVRDRDLDTGELFIEDLEDDSVIEVYKPGKYVPMSLESIINFVDSEVHEDDNFGPDVSDEEIEKLAKKLEKQANELGYTAKKVIVGAIERVLFEMRDNMRGEIESHIKNSLINIMCKNLFATDNELMKEISKKSEKEWMKLCYQIKKEAKIEGIKLGDFGQKILEKLRKNSLKKKRQIYSTVGIGPIP